MCAGLVLESHNFNFLMPITWPWLGCDTCGHKWWAVFLLPLTILYVFGNPGALLKRVAFLGPFVCVLTVPWKQKLFDCEAKCSQTLKLPQVQYTFKCFGSPWVYSRYSRLFGVASEVIFAWIGAGSSISSAETMPEACRTPRDIDEILTFKLF